MASAQTVSTTKAGMHRKTGAPKVECTPTTELLRRTTSGTTTTTTTTTNTDDDDDHKADDDDEPRADGGHEESENEDGETANDKQAMPSGQRVHDDDDDDEDEDEDDDERKNVKSEDHGDRDGDGEQGLAEEGRRHKMSQSAEGGDSTAKVGNRDTSVAEAAAAPPALNKRDSEEEECKGPKENEESVGSDREEPSKENERERSPSKVENESFGGAEDSEAEAVKPSKRRGKLMRKIRNSVLKKNTMLNNSKFDGAYIDPDDEKVGFMYKEGGFFKTWRKRWFVLRDGKLAYRTSPESEELLGTVHLEDVKVLLKERYTNARFESRSCICIKSKSMKRVYWIFAEDTADTIEWFDAMRDCAARALAKKPVSALPESAPHTPEQKCRDDLKKSKTWNG